MCYVFCDLKQFANLIGRNEMENKKNAKQIKPTLNIELALNVNW